VTLTGRTASCLAAVAAGLLLTGALAVSPAAADPPQDGPAPGTEASSSAPASDPPSSENSAPAEEPPPSSRQRDAAPAAERPQVEVSLVFDKPSYRTGDLVRFTFRIRNVGTIPAVGVQIFQHIIDPDHLNVIYDPGWGPLGSRPGVTIDPGASFQISVSGNIGDVNVSSVRVNGVVFDETGFGIGEFDFSAPVTKVFGHAAGTLFADRNGNGVFDNGEALAGATLTLRYQQNWQNAFTATTDAAGRFSFPELPTAAYFIGGEIVNGWLIPFDLLTIDESDRNDHLLVRGAPPLNGALHAELNFTADSYRPGELAHVIVKLSNTGATPMVGIVAACDRAGSHPIDPASGWDGLATREGVTIAPGQTRTFDVTEKVAEAWIDWGYVPLGCDFGYYEVDIEHHATAGDTAKVPGGITTLAGDVLQWDAQQHQNGPGLAGVRLVLVDKRDCPVVGEITTDGSGHFEFANLAPGPDYQVYSFPPQGWKLSFPGNPTPADVRGGPFPGRMIISVEPGEDQLPTAPTQPASCTATTTSAPTTTTTPAPQGRSSSGLASTGANVIGLSALGLLALLLGTGVVLTARRRRPTS
jgi:uncharacterized repeat protein (TIGR01451 family)